MAQYAIVGSSITSTCLSSLNKSGFDIISLPDALYLDYPISSHPDMLIFQHSDMLFCHREYYEKNSGVIEKIAVLSESKLKLCNDKTENKYPFDVLFNCACVGKNLFCNINYISKEIILHAQQNELKIVHVSQGYTKCSVCTVSDNAIITSDRSIHKATKNIGIDSLLISPGNVTLDRYEYGFIGGASGCCGNKIYFCGDFTKHPDGEKIQRFCISHNKTPISLSDDTLHDVGSILFI